ncbi:MAG: hypothetical protein LBQ38_09145 [Spirochaetaceae bacterium]|jgi:hypothetical protein|nr:hypothetical protein [Spirochaetaceae bacterium]
MSPCKTLVISLSVSLFFGLLSFLYTGALSPGGTGQGYGILSLDETFSDEGIAEALNRNGIGGVVSESSQWVFLDDFGNLERIPLGEYRERLEDFDPRNDGYAEQLRAFFVREGRRFFYIPLVSDRGKGALQKRVALSLGDTPYSLVLPRAPEQVPWLFILFGCAALGTLAFSLFPPEKGDKALFPALSLMPLLAPFALSGSAGFALSGALFGLFGVTLAPLREFFTSRRYRASSLSFRHWETRWGSDRVSWFLAVLFLLIYGLVCFTGGVPVLTALAAPVSFFSVLCTALWAEANQGKIRDHIRFLPVEIRDSRLRLSGFPRIVLPFALISLAALAPDSLVPGTGAVFYGDADSGGVGGDLLLPAAADYYRHAAFQASFSLRPLGAGPEEAAGPEAFPREGLGDYPYLRYVLGDDGLIARGVPLLDTRVYPGGDPGALGSGASMSGAGELPPFPLEDLTAFLGGRALTPEPGPGDLIPVCIILIPGFISFFGTGRQSRKKSGLLLYTDKQVAA